MSTPILLPDPDFFEGNDFKGWARSLISILSEELNRNFQENLEAARLEGSIDASSVDIENISASNVTSGSLDTDRLNLDGTSVVDSGGNLAIGAADFATQVSGAAKPANNATVGATWGSDITSQPSDADVMNDEVRVMRIDQGAEWKSWGTTSGAYSPSQTTQTRLVDIFDGQGNSIATRSVTGTVTYSSGNISVPANTVDGIAVTRTGNNSSHVVVTATHAASGLSGKIDFVVSNTDSGGAGK